MASMRTCMRFLCGNQQINHRYPYHLELSTKILLSNNKYKHSLYSNNKRFILTRRAGYDWENKSSVFKSSAIILAFLTVGLSVIFLEKKKRGYLVYTKDAQSTTGDFNPKLPSHTMEEVAKHNSLKDRVWVTFGQGVYDITDFIAQHPGGGEKIMLAAGGAVEPFWMMYGIHKTPKILAILEQYRIGNISLEDAKISTVNMEDPYSNDPERHPALHASSMRPYNAEPPTVILVDSFITPTALFYVRNHLPVPEVDEKSYTLEISGLGMKSTTLTLDDIKKFPKYSVTACIQCAGNRRSEMSKVKQVKGLEWGAAAIGNATWTGARLYDVLTSLGLKEDDPRVKHIQFEGLDTDVTNVPYGASIPIEKGMDPRGDVLLAYEMNGEPLTRDHGFPLRVIVPGIVGARNVKWLGSIVVSEEESSSHWQQNDYKGFSPSVDWDNVDWPTSPAIQELPVNSVIGEPVSGASLRLVNGKIKLKGYAFSGGGHQIVRVDVTADQGKSWHTAHLVQDQARPPRHWGWTLWTADIPVETKAHQVELWVKAVDNCYNTQPEAFENIWNLRGVLSNAYHRIKVNIIK